MHQDGTVILIEVMKLENELVIYKQLPLELQSRFDSFQANMLWIEKCGKLL